MNAFAAPKKTLIKIFSLVVQHWAVWHRRLTVNNKKHAFQHLATTENVLRIMCMYVCACVCALLVKNTFLKLYFLLLYHKTQFREKKMQRKGYTTFLMLKCAKKDEKLAQNAEKRLYRTRGRASCFAASLVVGKTCMYMWHNKKDIHMC